MKKKVFIILLIAVLIISLSVIKIQKQITGKATNSNLAISIQLFAPPSLTLISPENETYLNNASILLNFTSTGASNLFYNFDGGANTTITSATYFNAPQGAHTLYMYANNSNGTTQKNVTFTPNSNILKIYYSEYNSSKRGLSTDFINYSYEDLQTFSGVILENTDYGKIQFNQATNVTNDSNFSHNIVDLDSYTNISLNRIELNSVYLPNFNKKSTLSLYGLSFSDPRILKDGVVCSSTICTEVSYSAGIFVFNVTEFSVYSAEETTSTTGTGGATSSGGGGGSATPVQDFSIDKNTISVSLKQREIITEKVTIKNTGTQKRSFKISTSRIEDFLTLNEKSFELSPGESKTISLDFITRQTTAPDLYLGKIVITSDNSKKEILIAIDVSSKKALFDVRVEIPEQFLEVNPGKEIFANIQIFNLGEIGRVDTEIFHIIKDIDGNIISMEDETIAVETQTSFVKEIKIPASMKSGDYILQVRTKYNNETASSSAWFSVVSKENISWFNVILIFVIVILITSIIYKLREKR